LTDGKIAAFGNLEGLQQKFQCMLVKDVNGYLIILKLFSKNMHYNTCLDLFCVVRILWRFMQRHASLKFSSWVTFNKIRLNCNYDFQICRKVSL
jgi:hypothetical protein